MSLFTAEARLCQTQAGALAECHNAMTTPSSSLAQVLQRSLATQRRAKRATRARTKKARTHFGRLLSGAF